MTMKNDVERDMRKLTMKHGASEDVEFINISKDSNNEEKTTAIIELITMSFTPGEAMIFL